jgi:hypothetical protein
MKNKIGKIAVIFLFVLSSLITGCIEKNNQGKQPVKSVNGKAIRIKGALNFFIVSDWGWNGYRYQQNVADEMASFGQKIEPKFIISCGDNFQVNGVASTQDPLWLSNFENVYRDPVLLVDWFPVLGNHDYRGSTQAQIDYSKISRRWKMQAHYYTFARKINDSISARFIFLDTPPFVSEYYKSNEYPDIKQDTAAQLVWLRDLLANSTEKWKIVFGHHPVFSASKTHGNTIELIQKIKPLFDKYNVQFYFCGHDHDFQYLKEKNAKTNYIVTGTGGEPRPSSTDSLSVFSGSVPGFTFVSLFSDSIRVCFIDTSGNTIYKLSDK